MSEDAVRAVARGLKIPVAVIQFGVAPRRVDILTDVTGVDFASAWADRVEHPIGAALVPFMGRASFIANKRATGRLKDLADLESLGEPPGTGTPESA